MKPTQSLSDYQDKYEHYKFERHDGILQVTMHTNGSDLHWGFDPDDELGYVFEDIGRDLENKVIILTGSGDTFIHHENLGADVDSIPTRDWPRIMAFSVRLLNTHLDIPAPMIAAVNGPATIHAELAFLCDIVLAAEHAVFADQPHFPNGLVPGDGVQVIWPMLIGMTRARYALLTGQVFDAQQALNLGLVNEVLPQQDLLPRAWELARKILEQPPVTVAVTRPAFTHQIKQLLNSTIGFGHGLEGLAAGDYWPRDFKPAVLPGESE